MKKLKGKGGLDQCPICKVGNVEVIRVEYPDHENIIQFVRCDHCFKEFSELYKAVDWEETGD